VDAATATTPAASPAALERGSRLGPYELLLPIASGGMGHVWAAVRIGDFGFRRMVAVKVMREELAGSAEFRRMFLDEARLASRVLHSNVVEVVDLGEANGTTFQAMALVDGDSLAHLAKQARDDGSFIPPDVAARIACDALRGLHAAHELRNERGVPLEIVHRDVSPHNILVGLDGIAKITDFGIAKAAFAFASSSERGAKGKVAYMAPEQRRGVEVDRRADVYAMGVVLWELVTGLPATQRSAGDGAPAHGGAAPEPPAALLAIARRALDEAPELRFQTAEEMADAIEREAHASGLVLSSKTVAAWIGRLARDRVLQRKHDAEEQLARSHLGATHVTRTAIFARARSPRALRALLVVAAAALLATGYGAYRRWTAPRSPAPEAAAAPPAIADAPPPDVTGDGRTSGATPRAPETRTPTPAGSAVKPAGPVTRPRTTAPRRAPPAASSAAGALPPRPKYDNPYER